jgi:cytochrome c-type biogenesis protein CcmE
MTKKLDDELAEAILEKGADEAPAVARPVRNTAPAATARQKKNLGLLLTLLVMLGALVALFLVVFQPAAVYAVPVDEMVNKRSAYVGRKSRVEGELVPGSLSKRDKPCEYRFTIHKDDAKLPVRYAQCVLPDTFRDVPQGGVSATVEGALNKDGEFEATLVMAKCTSKYDPKTHEMNESPKPVGMN